MILKNPVRELVFVRVRVSVRIAFSVRVWVRVGVLFVVWCGCVVM